MENPNEISRNTNLSAIGSASYASLNTIPFNMPGIFVYVCESFQRRE